MKSKASINLHPTGLSWYYPTIEVLIVDDNAAELEKLATMARDIAGSSFVHTLLEPERLADLLRYYSPKVVLVSQHLRAGSGMALIDRQQRNYPNTAFVLLWDAADDGDKPVRIPDTVTDVIPKSVIGVNTLYAVLNKACHNRFANECADQRTVSVVQDV
jgi:DNA-binding NarL/FixJ family response regulator